MVIRDLQTGILWQQGAGEAMYEEVKGKRLEFLPYQQMSLEKWLQEYPITESQNKNQFADHIGDTEISLRE